MKEKENTSIVIHAMKENKNDMSDFKDVFDEMKYNIRVKTLLCLGNLAKQKHTTLADSSRPILVELQSNTCSAQSIDLMLCALQEILKALSSTKYSLKSGSRIRISTKS